MTPAPAKLLDTPSREHEILAAARRLWADRGYHAVSLRDIADVADVSLSLIAHHYGRKELLFAAVIEAQQARVAGLCRRLDADLTAAGVAAHGRWVAHWLDALLDLLASPDGGEYIRCVVRHRGDRQPEIALPLRRVFSPLRAPVEAWRRHCLPQLSDAQWACLSGMLTAALLSLADMAPLEAGRAAALRAYLIVGLMAVLDCVANTALEPGPAG